MSGPSFFQGRYQHENRIDQMSYFFMISAAYHIVICSKRRIPVILFPQKFPGILRILKRSTPGFPGRSRLFFRRRFSNADGERGTDFFNITAWRGTADNCAKFLKKGNKIAVSGSIQTRNYERADGTKGFAVDIIADEVEFLSSKNDGSSESNSGEGGTSIGGNSTNSPVADLQPIDDDLPF